MEEKKFSEERIERYEKAGYRILGEQKHSAIKVCRWAKESLRGKGDCYKKIFGVKSHRCIQMTPTLNLCNFSCGFCWRPFAENRHKAILDWDSPSAIIEDAIKFHKDVLAGFGGSKYVAKKKLKEALLQIQKPTSREEISKQNEELEKIKREKGMDAYNKELFKRAGLE